MGQLLTHKVACSQLKFWLKVAWLRVDTQTILTIAAHVITKNHRIAVNHSDRRVWFLHIHDVRQSDRGWYMCQLNTDPMKSQTAYLDVVGMCTHKRRILSLWHPHSNTEHNTPWIYHLLYLSHTYTNIHRFYKDLEYSTHRYNELQCSDWFIN